VAGVNGVTIHYRSLSLDSVVHTPQFWRGLFDVLAPETRRDRNVPSIKIFFAALLLFVSGPAFSQFSSQYRQAAQAYSTAAAQCQNPAGAACMRQNAQYYNCVANQMQGGSACGNQPSCSTACTGGASSGTGGNGLPLGGAGTSGNPKADAIGKLFGLGVQLMMNNDSDNSAPERAAPDPSEVAAQAAAAAAAAQQNTNAQAAQTLQAANSLLASMNGSSTASAPDSTAALSSLLGGDQPPGSSTAAISSLLDDNPPASTGSTNSTATIAGLLGSPSIPQPGPLNSVIQNPQFAGAVAQSQDPPPDPSRVANLGNDLLDDKAVDPKLSDLWQASKDNFNALKTTAGDLLHSHPIDSLAQSLGLKQDPNADPIDAAVHDCGVGMTAVALPHPAGGDAAAAVCGKSFSNAALSVLGMATD
jgi:hypothetical protein